MSFHSWLQSLRSALTPRGGQRQLRQRGSHRAATHRPNLEVLEDRSVPASSVWGDFNGDAVLDLATANYLSNNVSIFLGNADGTFQEAQNYATGEYPNAIAAGDLNGDGNLDLVTGSVTAYSNEISVLLGNGDGSFQWLTVYPWDTGFEGSSPQDVAVGDFDADGNLDLAVSIAHPASLGDVTVLLGSGQGYFGWGSLLYPSSGYFAPSVVTADFNRDGRADLAWSSPETNVIDVVLSNGDGTFQAAQSYTVATYPWTVTVADANADGNIDLVASSVLLGNGDGTFQTPPPLPPPPSLRINDVSVVEGNTGTVAATFSVTLSFASTETITVFYGTNYSTATGDSDYQGASGTLTFAPGETSNTITVLVNGDRLGEPNETFFVVLYDPTNATIADGSGLGTILDDEPRISINDVTVSEGNAGTVNATFTVSLSVAYDVAVTVHSQTANASATAGSDYAAASGDVIIAAGQTTKTLTVAVIGDRSAEPTENFVVNLSAATNGLIVDSQGVGTILDDEPRISISDVTKREGRKNATLFTFTVTLSAAYDQAVTMSFQTVNGTATTGDSDYIAKTGTLTFAPGETTKTITIEVKGDSRKEANETFYLDLFYSSSNSLFTKNRGICTILNDD